MSGTDVARDDLPAGSPDTAAKRTSPLLAYLWIWLPFVLMLGGMIFWQLRTGHLEQPGGEDATQAAIFEGAGVEVPVLLETLQVERERLAREWEDLRAVQKRARLEAGEVEGRQHEVEALLARVDEKVRGVSEDQGRMLDQLARVYETMKPDAAAGILAGTDVETATEILRRMKERNAAQILAKIPADNAARISKRMLRQP